MPSASSSSKQSSTPSFSSGGSRSTPPPSRHFNKSSRSSASSRSWKSSIGDPAPAPAPVHPHRDATNTNMNAKPDYFLVGGRGWITAPQAVRSSTFFEHGAEPALPPIIVPVLPGPSQSRHQERGLLRRGYGQRQIPQRRNDNAYFFSTTSEQKQQQQQRREAGDEAGSEAVEGDWNVTASSEIGASSATETGMDTGTRTGTEMEMDMDKNADAERGMTVERMVQVARQSAKSSALWYDDTSDGSGESEGLV